MSATTGSAPRGLRFPRLLTQSQSDASALSSLDLILVQVPEKERLDNGVLQNVLAHLLSYSLSPLFPGNENSQGSSFHVHHLHLSFSHTPPSSASALPQNFAQKTNLIHVQLDLKISPAAQWNHISSAICKVNPSFANSAAAPTPLQPSTLLALPADASPLLESAPTARSLLHLLQHARMHHVTGAFLLPFHQIDVCPQALSVARAHASAVVNIRQVPHAESSTPPAPKTQLFETWNYVRVHVIRKRASGRVASESLVARITYNGSECALGEWTVAKLAQREKERKYMEDPIEKLGLTFSTSLTERERRARSAVALPYVHRDPQKADMALVLHPPELRVGSEGNERGDGEEDADEEKHEDTSSDEEEIFSEDV